MPSVGHHQADADLQAVGPAVARIAALRQAVAGALALEIRARHVVQQQVVLQVEQRAQAFFQMFLDPRLCAAAASPNPRRGGRCEPSPPARPTGPPTPCRDTKSSRCAVRSTACKIGRWSEWRPRPAKATSSRPGSATFCKSASRPSSRHNPKAIHTSPKSRRRSRRMPFRLTNTGSSFDGSS